MQNYNRAHMQKKHIPYLVANCQYGCICQCTTRNLPRSHLSMQTLDSQTQPRQLLLHSVHDMCTTMSPRRITVMHYTLTWLYIFQGLQLLKTNGTVLIRYAERTLTLYSTKERLAIYNRTQNAYIISTKT